MWFSTWDGLSRFDGYTFATYRLPGNSNIASQSSRIDHLFEDRYRNIWALTYDSHAYRFDIETESFCGIGSVAALEGHPFSASNIIPMEGGNVWLLSQEDGCIVVTDSLLNVEVYHPRYGNLTDRRVNGVYEDREGNSWILTGKGITLLVAGESTPLFYFHHASITPYRDPYPFHCVSELDDEIWFGADKGIIWRYDKQRKYFRPLDTGLGSNLIAIEAISRKIALVSSVVVLQSTIPTTGVWSSTTGRHSRDECQ